MNRPRSIPGAAPDSAPGAGRVRTLIEAYGADPARWPEGDRSAALAWVESHPDEAPALLEAAAALDGLLDAWRLPVPAAALRTRTLAPAVVLVRQARRRSFFLTLGGGVGLAAACLAGIVSAPALVPAPAGLAPSDPRPVAVASTSTDDEVLSELLSGWEAPVGDPAEPAP